MITSTFAEEMVKNIRILEEDEFWVSLEFLGDDLEPDEVTRILGQKPTSFVRKGMEVTAGKRELGPANYGSWSFEIESSTEEIAGQKGSVQDFMILFANAD